MSSNILLVANYESDVGFSWWLMENFWSQIALHFHSKGMESFLIYPRINFIPYIVSSSPIAVIEHDFSNKKFGSLISLVQIIWRNKIGYVYLTDRAYYDWRYLVIRVVGVKTIVNHDHTPGERPAVAFHKKCIKKLIHFFNILSCDHYIGVSKFVKRRAIDVACVQEEKCSYVHNGIKIFDNNKTMYANDKFGIPQNSKIVVSTGRATSYKGIDLLIKCAHILINKKGVSDLYFLHIGSGPDLQKFVDLAAELEVGSKFIFGGFRDDIPKILPSCDIGIQISLGEAFSLSIIEYMCAGLATLAPNNCGNSEAIEDGVNGVLFNPNDIDDIANKILYVLNNVEFAMNIKEKARITVEKKFSIEQCNLNLLSLLDKYFSFN